MGAVWNTTGVEVNSSVAVFGLGAVVRPLFFLVLSYHILRCIPCNILILDRVYGVLNDSGKNLL